MPPNRSLTTKFFHLLIMLIVLHQLLVSSVMEGPNRGRPGDWFYELHEWGGLAGLGLLTLFWLWVFVRRNETPVSAMLPWFSSARRVALVEDLRLHIAALKDRHWPQSTNDAMASATHGLGLLTAMAMAATGAATLLWPGGSALHATVLSTHKVLANLMWAYLIGHASIAVLHHFAGDDSLKRMFRIRQPRDKPAKEPHV